MSDYSDGKGKKNGKTAAIISLSIISVGLLAALFILVILPKINKPSFQKLFSEKAFEEFGEVEEGDTVPFGEYPEEENGEDEKPIEWVVKEVSEDKSQFLFETKAPLPENYNEPTEEWLKDEFLPDLFGEEKFVFEEEGKGTEEHDGSEAGTSNIRVRIPESGWWNSETRTIIIIIIIAPGYEWEYKMSP